jgi:hypothetical protein
MVGDSLRSDIVGARMLGIFAIWKPKPRIRDEIKAHLVAPGAVSGSSGTPTISTFSDPDRPADLPPGMHITDDDYILAYARNRDTSKSPLHPDARDEVKPDLIIENLGDLLDVFLKAGVQ